HDIWLVTNIINHAVAANGFTGQDDLAREYLKTRLDDQQVYQEVSPPAFRGGCRKKHPWPSGECLIRDA
ncbi:hypothetical protein ACXO0C_07865, partial [Lactobacillus delbrueckii subsp. bulgaricus]